MQGDPRPVEALLRLRDLAAAQAVAALGRALGALHAEEAALEAHLAAREASRRRTEDAFRAPPGRGGAGLRAAARFRERLRARIAALDEAVRAQRGRVEEASAAAALARAAVAGAESRREAVAAHLRRWRAARQAAREAAEEEERDGLALSAAARR